MEEEAWDGILEKIVNVKTCMSHEEKEDLTITSNSSMVTPHSLTQAQQISQHVTLQKNNRTSLRNQESFFSKHTKKICISIYFKRNTKAIFSKHKKTKIQKFK